MGLRKDRPYFSEEQYLKLERAARERHEYLDGVIDAMAGESPEHADISFNLAGLLFPQLKGKPCRARTKDTKVRSGPESTSQSRSKCLYSYPDIVVVCGEPEYPAESREVILNPTVIIEVLSPTTEAFDRGEKCIRYQTWNASLVDYVLVAQDQPLVECFRRQDGGVWLLERFIGLDAVAPLPSIGCSLPLRDIYDRVKFPEPRPESEDQDADLTTP